MRAEATVRRQRSLKAKTKRQHEQYHLTVPVALLSPMAKILGATKLRTGALTRRAGALSLRNAVLPSSEAAGLKFRRVFMWVMQNRVDVLTSARDMLGVQRAASAHL